MSILVAIGVNAEGYREVLGAAEGTKEDKASWQGFLRYLKDRGLAEFYPEAAYHRCVVHFYRNVWSLTPSGKVRAVATMLKAIHASEDRDAARVKTTQVAAKLRENQIPTQILPPLLPPISKVRKIVDTTGFRRRPGAHPFSGARDWSQDPRMEEIGMASGRAKLDHSKCMPLAQGMHPRGRKHPM